MEMEEEKGGETMPKRWYYSRCGYGDWWCGKNGPCIYLSTWASVDCGHKLDRHPITGETKSIFTPLSDQEVSVLVKSGTTKKRGAFNGSQEG